jgi:hypothetical protein
VYYILCVCPMPKPTIDSERGRDDQKRSSASRPAVAVGVSVVVVANQNVDGSGKYSQRTRRNKVVLWSFSDSMTDGTISKTVSPSPNPFGLVVTGPNSSDPVLMFDRHWVVPKPEYDGSASAR